MSIWNYGTMSGNEQAAMALTHVILTIFRVSGALIQAGDDLVRDLGLTSARWQVIGAIALEARPLSVAQIARRMGLTRQSVQRVVNDLEREGLVALQDNPDHKRSRLVALTEAGHGAFDQAHARQAVWVACLAEGLDADAIAGSAELLRTLLSRLDGADASAQEMHGAA